MTLSYRDRRGAPDTALGTAAAGATARRAAGLLATAVLLTVLVGLLGASEVTLDLPGATGGLPPWGLGGAPPGWVVVLLTWIALLAGAGGLALALRALHGGWVPDPRRWLPAGVLAVLGSVLVAPMASGDPLIYAAYGRIAALGGDPYAVSPRVLIAYGDPIGLATEGPWQNVTSVYGPLATLVQAIASRLGGTSMHQTVFWMGVVDVLAWLAAGVLLLIAARGDRAARSRVLVLYWANPLLLWAVPYGGHNDSQALVFAVAALLALRIRRPVAGAALAGALIGLAGTVKLTEGIVGLGLLWAVRRRVSTVLALCAAAAVVLAAAYLPHTPQVFSQTSVNGSFISSASEWRWVRSLVDLGLTSSATRTTVSVLSWAGVAVLAVLLFRRVVLDPARRAGRPDRRATPARPRADDPVDRRGEAADRCGEAARAVVAITVAWLVLGAYTLPWYDLVAWAPLTLLAGSALDLLLLVRTTTVCLAYVATRQVAPEYRLDPVTAWVADRVRDTLSPAVHVVLAVALARWGLGHRGRNLLPGLRHRSGTPRRGTRVPRGAVASAPRQ